VDLLRLIWILVIALLNELTIGLKMIYLSFINHLDCENELGKFDEFGDFGDKNFMLAPPTCLCLAFQCGKPNTELKY